MYTGKFEKGSMNQPIRLPAHRVNQTPAWATVRIADLAADMRRKGIRVLDFSAGRAAEHSPGYINRTGSEALLNDDTHQRRANPTIVKWSPAS